MAAATAPASPKLMTISFAPANTLPEAALVVCCTTPPEVVPVALPDVVELVDAWPGERFCGASLAAAANASTVLDVSFVGLSIVLTGCHGHI